MRNVDVVCRLCATWLIGDRSTRYKIIYQEKSQMRPPALQASACHKKQMQEVAWALVACWTYWRFFFLTQNNKKQAVQVVCALICSVKKQGRKYKNLNTFKKTNLFLSLFNAVPSSVSSHCLYLIVGLPDPSLTKPDI